jgi:murein DD-endopeptidase MepM/ murein hydrolase activator NlpD
LGSPPDAGMISPIYAEPPELIDVLSLDRGQTLGGLLTEASLDFNEQEAVLLAFREQASPRRMRPGTEITLRRSKDDGNLRAVDVALSPDETVRLIREEYGWRSEKVETPVWVDTVYVAGEIEDVLWNAVTQNPGLAEMTPGDRAQLINKLDQIFQWQVDFSRQIQRGDFFRFAYERRVRPDGTTRDGRILAAELNNTGTSLFAIWFDPDGDELGSYFDREGKSVRRAFLLRPIVYSRISSRFSSSRFHPILKRWRAHSGIDFAASSGTPIMATADGVIVKRGRLGGLGNAIEIQHPNGFVTRYGHMSRFASGLKAGSRVKQEQVIGYVGMTGLASGPHLHYELRRRGRALDPLSVDLPKGDPVPEDAWDVWTAGRDLSLALLDGLPTGPAPTIATLTADDVDERGNIRASDDQGEDSATENPPGER